MLLFRSKLSKSAPSIGVSVQKARAHAVSRAAFETLEQRRLFAVNVLTFHNDLARDGQNLQETALMPANVNSTNFGKLFEYPTDGQAYAQPLIDTDIDVPGKGTHDIVYVATEHDSVYAFDADSSAGTNAIPLWKRSFINPSTGVTTIPYQDTNSGDLTPEIGITSTPVIDPTSNTIYVVANTKEVVNGVTTYFARLHALDLGTGAEKFGGPVVIAGSVPGTGVGSVNGTVAFQALWGNQRPALTLYNGVVFVAFAAHGDQGPYHGWIMAYAAGTMKQLAVFNTTPNGKGGGIWMSGSGLSVDSQGRLLVSTANGDFDGKKELGDTVLALSLTASGFTVTDSFTPYNQAYLSTSDQDLGSGGVLVLPTQSGSIPHEAVLGGKEGTLYLVNLDNLGGYSTSGSDSQIVQSIRGVVTRVFCALAYYNGSVYVQGTGGSLMRFSLTNGKLSTTPVAHAVHVYGFPGATPVISGNGNSNGIVWMIEPGNPAELHALDATTLAEIYNSNASGVRDQPTAHGVKFTPPVVANGKVYVATSSSLAVYGLFPKATKVPPAPTGLAVVVTSASTIDLSFSAGDTSETGFVILRSADGTNFSRVNVLPAGVTTYTDVALQPSTKYYYRLEAANTAGTSGYIQTVSGQTFAQSNLTGIVGYWRMDEASGGTIFDSSSTGQTGTIVGETTRVPGIVGPGALSFHGTGMAISQVQMLDKPAWNFTASQSFTVGAWIDPERLIGKTVGVVAKSADITPNYGIYINASNQWQFEGATPINGSTATLGWQYVTIVQDAAANKRYLYVNGNLVGSGAAQDASGKGDLWLGTARGSSVYFPGMIDDVRIYNLALSQSQIKTIVGETDPNSPNLTSIRATSSTTAVLTWNEPSGNSAGTATGFTIQQLTSSGSYTNIGLAAAGATTFTATGLTPGAIDTFRVVAFNAAGNNPSQTLTVTMPTSGTGGGSTASIAGTVSKVVNGTTSVFSGVTIFLDANNNGSLDSSEPSIVTGASGAYSFSNLTAGTYRLREVTPSGYNQTTPTTVPTDVTLVTGQQATGLNFVDTAAATTGGGGASVSGFVYNDLNKNAKFDGTDARIAGATVFLDQNKNGLFDSGELNTLTAGDGSYTISGLPAGNFRIREQLPTGYTLSTGASYDVTVTSNSALTYKNFGNVAGAGSTPSGGGSISGFVYADTNGNGVFQTNESGIAGVTLFLDTNKNGIKDTGEATAVTTANGSYTFGSLAAATYRVREIVPAGKTLTTGAFYDVTLPINYNAAYKNFGNR